MNRTKLDSFGNVFAFAVVILFNTLANTLPLGGQTTGAISDKYDSLFTPAGFTFSIWGLIYLALLGFVIRQVWDVSRDRAFLSRIGVPFKINCLANALWIVAWHYNQLILSMVIMVAILATLVSIYRTEGYQSSHFLFIQFPFSLYLGWITVATIANVSVLQNAYGWDAVGLSPITWTIVKLALAGFIGAMVGMKRQDVVYVAVIAWAAFGISVGQMETAAVSGAASLLSLLSLMVAGWVFGLHFSPQDAADPA